MLLAPDEVLGGIYQRDRARIRHGAALGFSHGLAIRFGLIVPRADLDVFMVAPKGPGPRCGRSTSEGKGMVALVGGRAGCERHAREALALAYGRRSAAPAPA